MALVVIVLKEWFPDFGVRAGCDTAFPWAKLTFSLKAEHGL